MFEKQNNLYKKATQESEKAEKEAQEALDDLEAEVLFVFFFSSFFLVFSSLVCVNGRFVFSKMFAQHKKKRELAGKLNKYQNVVVVFIVLKKSGKGVRGSVKTNDFSTGLNNIVIPLSKTIQQKLIDAKPFFFPLVVFF